MGRPVAVQALLDTHTFLWWILDDARLSRKTYRLIANEANEFFVSAVSGWEITTKFRIGKLPYSERVALDIAAEVAAQGFKEMSISIADGERAGLLPGHHRDPFDRMLIAQAQARSLPLVSADKVFDAYDVNRLW
jgi:PIN domain nuclease of toxin-antitoxin system